MRIVKCQYCGNNAKLMDSSTVYRRSYGMIWRCIPCDAYVGTHSNSDDYAPLGGLANAALRNKRKMAHASFDVLWQSGNMTRKAAYLWLADSMAMDTSDAHIGKFNENQCIELVNMLQARKRLQERFGRDVKSDLRLACLDRKNSLIHERATRLLGG